jgi:WD40 repeat protein
MDDTVRIWDLKHDAECVTVSGFPSQMGILAFSPDGRALAVNEARQGVISVDVATCQKGCVYSYPESHDFYWSCYAVSYGWGMAYSSDGKKLAAGGSHNGDDGFVTLWDTESRIGSNVIKSDNPVTAVAFAPDGKAIASASLDGTVQFWDLAAGRERFSIATQAVLFFDSPIRITSSGDRLVTAHKDRTIRLWDTATGREVGKIGPHQGSILCFALSPDDDLLAVADKGGNILVREVLTGRVLNRLVGHQGPVWSIAFSPDGRSIATGGKDRTVRLWDVVQPP